MGSSVLRTNGMVVSLLNNDHLPPHLHVFWDGVLQAP